MRCGDCLAFRERGECVNHDSPNAGRTVSKSDEPCASPVFRGEATCYRCGQPANGYDVDIFEHRPYSFPRFTARLCAQCSRDFERWLLMMEPEAQGRLF